MDTDLIKVDFQAKQVVEAPTYTIDEVCNAIEILKNFLREDFRQKELDISNALQIMDHDLEDMSDAEINEIDAVAVLKRRRILRTNRRDIKNQEILQERIKKQLPTSLMNNIANSAEQFMTKVEEGSSDKFYSNSINRSNLKNKVLLKNSRIKAV